MSYLDKNGLTYLWSKIKAALGGKGDSLTLNNQTLSLKAGENVLSSVTLSSGGGGSSSGGGAIYSTEERVIGRWIDNRPLYQKTFDITGFYTQGDEESSLIILPAGCEIKRWYGYIHDYFDRQLGYNKTKVTVFLVEGERQIEVIEDYLFVHSVDNCLYFESGRNTVFSDTEVIVTVEYTKTTDQPGS